MLKNIFKLLGISFNFIYRDDSSDLVTTEFKHILDNPDDKKKYINAISRSNPDPDDPDPEIVLGNGNRLLITNNNVF